MCWIQQTHFLWLQKVAVWGVLCGGCRFLSRSLLPPFTLLSVLSTEFHIAGGKKQKAKRQKHSSPCLIHWAATVNVQRGGKDNFSRGRLPGTTLDHRRLPSSLFSLKFMNKNAVKSLPNSRTPFYLSRLRIRDFFFFPLRRDDGLSARSLKWINTVCVTTVS